VRRKCWRRVLDPSLAHREETDVYLGLIMGVLKVLCGGDKIKTKCFIHVYRQGCLLHNLYIQVTPKPVIEKVYECMYERYM